MSSKSNNYVTFISNTVITSWIFFSDKEQVNEETLGLHNTRLREKIIQNQKRLSPPESPSTVPSIEKRKKQKSTVRSTVTSPEETTQSSFQSNSPIMSTISSHTVIVNSFLDS